MDFEGSRRHQSLKPKLNAKHDGKFRETRGAGGRGDGLWERRFRPDIAIKSSTPLHPSVGGGS